MQKKGRSGARRLAMQAFYQSQLTGHALDVLQDQFREQSEYTACDSAYFEALLVDVDTHRTQLDADIAAYSDIVPEQLDPVEHAILWLALAEMRFHEDVPVPVVINEAIELAKLFGAEGGHRYVNGLLDKAGQNLRPAA